MGMAVQNIFALRALQFLGPNQQSNHDNILDISCNMLSFITSEPFAIGGCFFIQTQNPHHQSLIKSIDCRALTWNNH